MLPDCVKEAVGEVLRGESRQSLHRTKFLSQSQKALHVSSTMKKEEASKFFKNFNGGSSSPKSKLLTEYKNLSNVAKSNQNKKRKIAFKDGATQYENPQA